MITFNPIFGQEEVISPLVIKPLLPGNQNNGNDGFFNLTVKPGVTQTLEIELTNNSDEKLVFLMEANVATINSNGIVDYSRTDSVRNNSAPVQFLDSVTIDPTITINPKETKIASILLRMPETEFDGIILGGITFTPEENPEDKVSGIASKLSYTIGIVLTQNETVVPPKLEFEKVFVEQIESRVYIQSILQNNQSMILEDLSIGAKILKKGEEEFVYSRINEEDILYFEEVDNVRMAPNSNFVFRIDTTGNKAFNPVDYTIYMTALAGDQKWEWKEDFIVTDKTIKPVNTISIAQSIQNWNWINLVYLVIGLSLGIGTLILVRKNNDSK